jgi:hypothetical protein
MHDLKSLELVKLSSVAKELGLRTLTLTREHQRGRLRLAKLGGVWFVKRADLNTYLAAAGVTLDNAAA